MCMSPLKFNCADLRCARAAYLNSHIFKSIKKKNEEVRLIPPTTAESAVRAKAGETAQGESHAIFQISGTTVKV